jgi:hypothetical protein
MEEKAMKRLGKFIKDLVLYVAIQVLTAFFFILGFFSKEQRRLFPGKTIR